MAAPTRAARATGGDATLSFGSNPVTLATTRLRNGDRRHLDRRDAVAAHLKVIGDLRRDIGDPALNIGAAVLDPDFLRAAVPEVPDLRRGTQG